MHPIELNTTDCSRVFSSHRVAFQISTGRCASIGRNRRVTVARRVAVDVGCIIGLSFNIRKCQRFPAIINGP